MRIVRVQVSARERYRGPTGMFDTRSVTLEAELESGDGDVGAIWELQRKVDDCLESWIDLHKEVEPVTPVPFELPVPGGSVETPPEPPDLPF